MIAFVTDAESYPIDYDMAPLLKACARYDLPIDVVYWDNLNVDWSKFGLVLLRSPWSYTKRLPEFLKWCRKVSAVTRIVNPAPVVEWSLDKHYLLDLEQGGIPIVPTEFIEPGETDIENTISEFIRQQRDCLEIVAKPSVGAYSKDVMRFKVDRKAALKSFIQSLNESGACALIQPYLSSIDLVGETNLIYFNGQFSHAIRKDALLAADGTVNAPTENFRTERKPDATEINMANKCLSIVGERFGLSQDLLYARIDLIRDNTGMPVVLEMEIAEPSLSLSNCKGGAESFAAAINTFVEGL